MLENLEKLAGTLFKREAKSRFSEWIPADHVLDDRLGGKASGEPLEIGKSYFSISLSEMRLNLSGQLWNEYMPMVAVVVEYLYGGKPTQLPIMVGQDLVRQLLKQDSKKSSTAVELVNTKLLGPVPVEGEAVGILTVMYRVLRSDNLAVLLDVLGDVGKTLGVHQVEMLVPTAKALYAGIGKLLHAQSEQPLMGKRDELRSNNKGLIERSGYMVHTTALADDLSANNLWIKNGQLHHGSKKSDLTRFTGSDFCVIAVEKQRNRLSFADLPCETIWQGLQAQIWDGKTADWQAERIRLLKTIRQSNDLTKSDKSAALLVYTNLIEEELALAERSGVSVRGTVRKNPSVSSYLAEGIPEEATDESKNIRQRAFEAAITFVQPPDRSTAKTKTGRREYDLDASTARVRQVRKQLGDGHGDLISALDPTEISELLEAHAVGEIRAGASH